MSVSFDKEYVPAISSQDVRHKVMRNTYWLLALAMIPSVLGAMIGVKYNVPMPRGILGLVVFLGVMYGFMYAIEKTKDSANGIGVLFLFTFCLGLWLTPLLTHTLHMQNGGTLIMMAFGGTASVLAVMATIATVSKRDFSVMGKFLGAATIALILASVVAILFSIPMLHIVISVLAIGIFSAWILYDVQKVINGGETNYIRAAMMLFIDVYVIFSNMLSLLGLGGSRD
ncbi:MAG: Bax inhibitor-1 family protein [Pseudomonadota bacterium]